VVCGERLVLHLSSSRGRSGYTEAASHTLVGLCILFVPVDVKPRGNGAVVPLFQLLVTLWCDVGNSRNPSSFKFVREISSKELVSFFLEIWRFNARNEKTLPVPSLW